MKIDQNKLFFIPFLFIILMLVGLPRMSCSQCEPDTVSCVDIDEPGQMCPDKLPSGIVGIVYDQNLTILSPASGSIGQVNINLYKIRLESIENLPEGIEFSSETVEFFPNEAYCVSLTGTPVEAGTYHLKIYVTPFIRVLGFPVPLAVYVDSTSIVMTVDAATSIRSVNRKDFALIHAYPNPFIATTRLGFRETAPAEAELLVYSMLGRQLYRERIMGVIGENYFDFTGQDLPPGYYLYSIIREDQAVMGRMIKSR